jgi:hypothetical protein
MKISFKDSRNINETINSLSYLETHDDKKIFLHSGMIFGYSYASFS